MFVSYDTLFLIAFIMIVVIDIGYTIGVGRGITASLAAFKPIMEDIAERLARR